MEYETRLPATHLSGETLRELADLVRSECTEPDLEIRLEHERVTYRYVSVRKLTGDVVPPALVRKFEVVVSAREGRIRLVSDGRRELRLCLNGDHDWVRARGDDLEDFFRTHGSRIRTALERYLALGLAALAVLGGLLCYYAGLGPLVGMQVPADALLYGSLAIFLGGLLHLLLGAVYPYALLVTDTRVGRHPYVYTTT